MTVETDIFTNARERYKDPENPTRNSPKGDENSPLNRNGNEPTFDYQDDVFKKWDKALESGRDENLSKLLKELTGTETVLDIGTGLRSAFVRYLEAKQKIGKLIAMDLDPSNLVMQEYLYGNNVSTNLIQADAAKIPLADDSVDVISSFLMMADNPVNELVKLGSIQSEIDRVLKKGGLLITNDDIIWGESIRQFIDPDTFELVYRVQSGKWFRVYRKK